MCLLGIAKSIFTQQFKHIKRS